MVDFVSKPRYDVDDLKKLISILCGPEGCPWDREQTHESICRNLLEEAYEAAEAIKDKNTESLIEELGDVLMQVVFHADIAGRSDSFDLDDITDATCKKLIRRHPHVFGDVRVKDDDESLMVWDDIKRKEKHHETTADAMRSVAHTLPALWQAEKIQKKAAKTGFDWPDYTGALDALRMELAELEQAISASLEDSGTTETKASKYALEEELGDLLFSAVNVSRFFDIDPESALRRTCEKFISRFTYVENNAKLLGKKLGDMTLDEMEALYQKGKDSENR
ncbi:MAG: nucleoside triphosphate pyrophosphohydrolase [Oscillospiraceae bacterium]|jgi:tetrapyrrole methylase family protein/MazG family protein|nr:nucleoside triphosphate pyrophosphohydrolase [Oscillospiraceae bacterium]